MRRRVFGVFLCVWIFLSFGATATASGVTVTSPPVSTTVTPSAVITSFGGVSTLDFAELYNQSDAPVDLTGWRLGFTLTDSAACAAGVMVQTQPLSGWLLSDDYVTLQNSATVGADDTNEIVFTIDPSALAACTSPQLSSLQLLQPDGTAAETVTVPSGTLTAATPGAQHKQRGKSTLNLTGTFATDYKVLSTPATTYSDPLYLPPDDVAGLEIIEVLPNSRSCSPIDTSLDCSDYVKLYNPTSAAIDLSLYELRTDSGGLKSSISNTVPLDGMLVAGAYLTVHMRSDGTPLSITNTGGYVWLEDAYGVQTYLPIVNYPDASATSKQDMSWALDSSDAMWKWMPPAPDAPNYWPPVQPIITTATVKTFADCGPGKMRNPLTNRCRNIVSTASTLQPCAANQTRNPETNRCRSVLGASTTLAPCAPGQTRNPDTNRCRKTVASNTAALAKVRDLPAATTASWKWWLVAVAILVGVAYAVYEWRHEVTQFARKKLHRPTRS